MMHFGVGHRAIAQISSHKSPSHRVRTPFPEDCAKFDIEEGAVAVLLEHVEGRVLALLSDQRPRGFWKRLLGQG